MGPGEKEWTLNTEEWTFVKIYYRQDSTKEFKSMPNYFPGSFFARILKLFHLLLVKRGIKEWAI